MVSNEFDTPWRRIASTIYDAPKDSKLLGSADLDITEAKAFIQNLNDQGIKLSLTHLLAVVIGQAIAQDVPEFNCYTARGKIFKRSSITASVSVLGSKNSALVGAKLIDVHNMSLQEVSEQLNNHIRKIRNEGNADKAVKGDFLASIPWPLRSWIFKLIRLLVIRWGLSFPFIKVNPESFGSFILSNIGSVGLDVGYGALMPASNLALAVFMGKAGPKATVHNGELVIREMLTISASVDHRVVDGHHAGLLFKSIKKRLKSTYLNRLKIS